MQLAALIPVVALLATTPLTSAARHGQGHRRHLEHIKHVGRDDSAELHARAVDSITQNLDRKDQLAAQNPPAIRKVKRGANKACRVKGSSFTPSASASTSAATSAATSSAATAAVSTTASWATTTAAASTGDGNDWTAPTVS